MFSSQKILFAFTSTPPISLLSSNNFCKFVNNRISVAIAPDSLLSSTSSKHCVVVFNRVKTFQVRSNPELKYDQFISKAIKHCVRVLHLRILSFSNFVSKPTSVGIVPANSLDPIKTVQKHPAMSEFEQENIKNRLSRSRRLALTQF